MNSGNSAHGLHLGDVSSYTSGEPDPLYWLLMKLIVLMNGLDYIYLIGVLGQAEGLSRTVVVVQRFRLVQTPVIVCYICCVLNVLMLKLSWSVFCWTDSQSTPCFECTWLISLQTRNSISYKTGLGCMYNLSRGYHRATVMRSNEKKLGCFEIVWWIY